MIGTHQIAYNVAIDNIIYADKTYKSLKKINSPLSLGDFLYTYMNDMSY